MVVTYEERSGTYERLEVEAIVWKALIVHKRLHGDDAEQEDGHRDADLERPERVRQAEAVGRHRLFAAGEGRGRERTGQRAKLGGAVVMCVNKHVLYIQRFLEMDGCNCC